MGGQSSLGMEGEKKEEMNIPHFSGLSELMTDFQMGKT